ncbi:NAD(P)/FAD-dependent oxidoreductase [Actinoplanes sp. N902-109]|uniref:NAD(P)/FAD-dependent oxidoreductase n=1 Tax=Actinoplanes sp. (strain N902-109) TaxID=649831 RepID=UPI0003294E3E|nr:NAD(P)/FAD-dependent oxidoreductase [Actinoplanes sp. N902-109]AGL14184.1 FAD-dependent pyridine nucleotide-disulfide oxidoreductase [Actinoplanes sp. N902-109]
MPRPRIVIVGAGFAGFEAARTLSRLSRGAADIVLVNPTDYFLYLPLLPEVAAGILEPRRISVSITGELPAVRLILGEVDGFDFDARTVSYVDPDGGKGSIGYHRLVIAAGSVNKLLPVPGVTEYAHGFRGIPEALFLRDHIVRQIEMADITDDPAERESRSTFVVVGAGYTGTELAAQGVLFTEQLTRHRPALKGRPRWLLLDTADRVLPSLDERLAKASDEVLRERGIEVLLKTSVKEATSDGVHLSNGDFVPTRSLIWCVGVRPDPLVADIGLEVDHGRVVVDEFLNVPGLPDVYAVGDAAAVPDLTRPGEITGMTAQHATRQGKTVAHNIAASYGKGRRRPYKHHDLGFVVDLGGLDSAANPVGVPLRGFPAKVVTRGYHLLSMPGNRVRVAADWLLDAVLPRQGVQLGLVSATAVPLDSALPQGLPDTGATEGKQPS